MGIKSAFNGIKATFVRYSSFLGMLYIATSETESAIKEAKALVGGDDAVKKGYTGYKGDSPSAKARAFLAEKGVMPVKIEDCALTSVKCVDVDIEGKKEPYLSVGFTDEEGRYVVSLALAHPAAQLLVRKLANAKPKANSELSMYANYEKSEKDGNYYAEHKVFLVQNGDQVKGVDPKTTFAPAVDAALQVLRENKIDDKKVLAARRAGVVIEYHVNLLKEIEARFIEAVPAPQHSGDEVPAFSEEDLDVPF